MNTTPTAKPGLQIVGYGIESDNPNARHPMAKIFRSLNSTDRREIFTELVRESDALAAIEAMRVEASNAATIAKLSAEYIEALRAERDALAAQAAMLTAEPVVWGSRVGLRWIRGGMNKTSAVSRERTNGRDFPLYAKEAP